MRVGPLALAPLGDDDPDLARHLADRRGIVHAEALHEEAEDVARLVADVAVEHPLLRDDGQVAVRPAVEGTGAAIVRAGPLQVHGLADDRHDVGGVADLLDHFVRNAHGLSSATVAPVPPWFEGANA